MYSDNRLEMRTVMELVVSEQSQLVVSCEHGSRGISVVRSRYQATTGEDRTN
jgi:hypothetical protein